LAAKIHGRNWNWLISRHPYEASKQWIEQNEKEILELDLEEKKRNILLDYLNEVE
jgi:hypothetical protein